MPTPSAEVENEAVPAEFRIVEPRLVGPSLKLMVPVGVPAPGATALTVAVKITVWLKFEGFVVEVSEIAVEALFTVRPTTEEFWLKLPSPPYVAIIECCPEVSAEMVKDACPLARFAVPRFVRPSRKVTVPVGVPEPGAVGLTVTAATTGWPKTLGLGETLTVTAGTSKFTICINGDEVVALKLLSPE